MDTSASTKILPLSTSEALRIPQEKNHLRATPSGRDRIIATTYPRTCILRLEGRTYQSMTLMHVMKGDTSYHIILGHLWLRAHKAMASTYHQCVKVVWKGRPMNIEATRMPDDWAEFHHTEVALYQKFELGGENKIVPFNATVLEREEDDDGEVIELEKPSKIRRITMLDGKVVYEF